MKIVLLGTVWPYRGGLASFNERLLKEFQDQGHEVLAVTFTVQYPGFLFPGKTQYSTSPAPEYLTIQRKVNSINPLSWFKVGRELKKMAPDIIIIKYWMPFMAPAFGTIAKIAKKNKLTKVVCIADNIIPHEPKFYDKSFTRYFVNQCDRFVVMSASVLKDLLQFNRNKLRATNPHPLFDNFGEKLSKAEACQYLKLDVSKNYILFFGFIRDYKGLDLMLQAMALIKSDVELIIAGEYYTDEKPYQQLITSNQLQSRVHQFNHFIADEEVKYFFSVADMVVQPYKHATQSGVTQIAYHFEVPMVVTNVGGLPEMVPHNHVGYVTAPTAADIANAIDLFYTDNRSSEFTTNLQEEKKRFGWDRMVQTILALVAR